MSRRSPLPCFHVAREARQDSVKIVSCHAYIRVCGILVRVWYGAGNEPAELHEARAAERRQQVFLRQLPGEAGRAAVPDAAGSASRAHLQPQQVSPVKADLGQAEQEYSLSHVRVRKIGRW